MIVSNNTLLNILLPNNNSALKNVLQEADAKQLTSNSKDGTSIQSIIKNLFSDTLSGTKSNETIQNMLKNSNVFKDMGSFTNQLKQLETQIKGDPKFAKFESVIKNFLVNIKNLDESVLKEQMGKSGVFLESKLNDTLKTNNLPNKIENILTQLKQELVNVKTPQAKEIIKSIDTLLNSKTNTNTSLTSDLKGILNGIKNLDELKNSPQIQNLVKEISQLKSLKNEIKLLDSKITNNTNTQQIQEPTNKTNPALLNKQASSISTEQTAPKNTPVLQIKEALNTVLQNLSKTDSPQAKQLTQEVSTILSQKNVPLQNVLEQTKSLVSKLQNFTINQPVSESINNLTSQSNTLKLLAYNTPASNIPVSLGTNSANAVSQTIPAQITPNTQINEVLNQIKQILSNSNIPKAQTLVQDTNTVQNLKNSDVKEFMSSVKTLVNKLESTLINIPTSATAKTLSSLTSGLKQLAYTPMQTAQTVQSSQNVVNPINQNASQNIQSNNSSVSLMNEHNIPSKLSNILSNMKAELLNNNLPLTKDILPMIDKLLGQNSASLGATVLQSNITDLLTAVKTVISNTQSQSNVQSEQIYKLLNQLENSVKPNSPLLSNSNLQMNPELQKNNINNDMKSMLLQLNEELVQNSTPSQSEMLKTVDKLLTQVDYYQLMSLTSTSNYIYFPFIWDMLEDGSLSMKKINDEKFFVEINLKLKEYGKVDMLLIMYDENHLDISIFAQKQNLKDEFKEHLQNLKKNLSGVGIVPGTIKLLDLKEDEVKGKSEEVFADVYEEHLGFGVNIKV